MYKRLVNLFLIQCIFLFVRVHISWYFDRTHKILTSTKFRKEVYETGMGLQGHQYARNICCNQLLLTTNCRHPPHLHISPYLAPDRSGNDKYEGFIKDLSDKIAELLGVNYEIKPVKDGRLVS